eukprot:GAHX01003294.1.p1 GENE.GAHX01003294.1~~GAHX01003294.1.p1  ORF type:complete len:177 (-),score=15.19 GAHX01003294.1:52-582(-)
MEIFELNLWLPSLYILSHMLMKLIDWYNNSRSKEPRVFCISSCFIIDRLDGYEIVSFVFNLYFLFDIEKHSLYSSLKPKLYFGIILYIILFLLTRYGLVDSIKRRAIFDGVVLGAATALIPRKKLRVFLIFDIPYAQLSLVQVFLLLTKNIEECANFLTGFVPSMALYGLLSTAIK